MEGVVERLDGEKGLSVLVGEVANVGTMLGIQFVVEDTRRVLVDATCAPFCRSANVCEGVAYTVI